MLVGQLYFVQKLVVGKSCVCIRHCCLAVLVKVSTELDEAARYEVGSLHVEGDGWQEASKLAVAVLLAAAVKCLSSKANLLEHADLFRHSEH